MSVRGYPFDTTDPAGSVTELEWRRLMQWIMPSGVLRGEDNALLVAPRAAGANMSVDVATGCAFLVGHYVRSDAVESVAIADNLTGNPRIDTIVVGMDFVANEATIYVLAGAVAAAPAPAALTQDLASKWEEALAYVYVAAGENVSITAPELSDCRHFAEPQAQDLEQVARLATTAALAASTITGVDRVANANGALANIDGTAAVVGDRILDKDHATGSARGLWRIVDVGSASKPWRMRRSYAADTSAKMRAGLWIRVAEGTTNGDTGWLLTTNDPIVLGTTALTFTQFPAAASAALTTDVGVISGDVTLTASSTIDVKSTAALATGVWLVAMHAAILCPTASTGVALQCVVGTATATFTGPRVANGISGSGTNTRMTIGTTFIATVTVAGTLKMQAYSSANASTAEQVGGILGGTVPATGYTAVKIG